MNLLVLGKCTKGLSETVLCARIQEIIIYLSYIRASYSSSRENLQNGGSCISLLVILPPFSARSANYTFLTCLIAQELAISSLL